MNVNFQRLRVVGGARAMLAALLLLLGVGTTGTAIAQNGNGNGNGGGQLPPPPSICTDCEPDPTPVPKLAAEFSGQSFPPALSAGYTYPVTITMTNTGSETWAAGSVYRLGSQNPQDNTVWGMGRVVVPTSVPTNASVTFAFEIKAPATAGTYNFQWRMVKDGVAWFGDTTPNVALVVGPYNPPPTVSMTAPAAGGSSTAPVSLALAANAADAGGSIASVRFYANGQLLATDTSAPFAFLYGDVPPGSYQFTAVATDNGGAYTKSSPLAHTVSAGTAGTVSAVRRYVYDANQRLCKTIDPESGATVYGYDAASNIVWIAEGQNLPSTTSCDQGLVATSAKTVREYDAMNRMWRKTTPDNVGNLSKTFTPDGLDDTVSATNAGGAVVTTTYQYNRRRLLELEISSNGSTVFGLGYGFTPNGHLRAVNYPDGQVVEFTPDGLGRATDVRSATGVSYARDIGYHPGGAISGFTYGNGIVHTMAQNRRQLPSRSIDQLGATKVLDDSLFFDENGNVSDIVDGAQDGKTSRGMAYDALDRLTMVVSDKQWGVASYAYDALDNIRINDLGARKSRYEYDALSNRLSRIRSPDGTQLHDFGYDSRGNTTRKNAQAYVFDHANRMAQVVGLQSYRYDALGRRVQTTDADGKTTFWMYSQSGQVMFTSEARRSQNLAYIYLGNTQLATRATAWGTGVATVRYQHTDMLGSPVAETSAAGAVLKRTSFSPYGEPWQSAAVDGTGYTGHVMDAATGLTYMQQRYYWPESGRFLSEDSVEVRSVDGSNFNRFKYANNNPYAYTDPDGRNEEIAYGAGVAIALRNSPDRLATVRRAEAAAGRGDAVAGIDAGTGFTEAVAVVATAGGVVAAVKALWNVVTRDRPKQERYDRRSYRYRSGNPNARAARQSAEGQPCPTCGQTMVAGTATAPQAQHSPSLSEFHYEHGGAEMSPAERKAYSNSAAALDGSNCATCQRKEGAAQKQYVRKKESTD